MLPSCRACLEVSDGLFMEPEEYYQWLKMVEMMQGQGAMSEVPKGVVSGRLWDFIQYIGRKMQGSVACSAWLGHWWSLKSTCFQRVRISPG